MITVVLVEPSKSGNLGAVCRAVKNFGFDKLLLVNPKCKKDSLEAVKRSKHASDVLRKAKVVKSFDYLKKFDYLIATTSKLGTDYNIPRSPVDVEQLAKLVKGKKGNVAIVFGREGKGLYNGEINKCDYMVTIPTDKKYPVMNLSHSVAVICYELSKEHKGKVSEHIIFAGEAEKKQLMKMLNSALAKMSFTTPEKKDTQRKVWRRMIGKSFMTKREAYALMGFLRKIK